MTDNFEYSKNDLMTIHETLTLRLMDLRVCMLNSVDYPESWEIHMKETILELENLLLKTKNKLSTLS